MFPILIVTARFSGVNLVIPASTVAVTAARIAFDILSVSQMRCGGSAHTEMEAHARWRVTPVLSYEFELRHRVESSI